MLLIHDWRKTVQSGGKIEHLISNALTWKHWTEQATCAVVDLRLGCFKVSLICMRGQTLGKMVTHLLQHGSNPCVHLNRLLGILIQGSRCSGCYQNMNRASTLLMLLWLPPIQGALAPATHFSRCFIWSYSFNPQLKVFLKSLLLLKTQYY